jgi:hypothetical protein
VYVHVYVHENVHVKMRDSSQKTKIYTPSGVVVTHSIPRRAVNENSEMRRGAAVSVKAASCENLSIQDVGSRQW